MVSKQFLGSILILTSFLVSFGDCAANSCRKTECVTDGPAECSSLTPMVVRGKRVIYDETATDECVDENDTPGEVALCCPINSKDQALTTLLGVESHQFPHFARVIMKKGKGVAHCGGTIYNQRW